MKINTNRTFKFYSDPSHGWLAVPIDYLLDVDINAEQISMYSYIKGKTVYLEEDCDAGKFIAAWEATYGNKILVDQKSTEKVVRFGLMTE